MIASKKSKIVRNLIFVVVGIIFVLVLIYFVNIRTQYSDEDVVRLNYMNSNKIKENVLMIPYNINMVYSQYSGEVSLTTIEKSIYYFSNNVVPHYKEFFSKQYINEIESYFEQNQFAIGVDTGISDVKEFKALVNGILLLDDNLTIQTYELSDSTPSKTSHHLVTRLLVKYKNNKRIIFKVKVSNEKLKNISSIKYSYESIEN